MQYELYFFASPLLPNPGKRKLTFPPVLLRKIRHLRHLSILLPLEWSADEGIFMKRCLNCRFSVNPVNIFYFNVGSSVKPEVIYAIPWPGCLYAPPFSREIVTNQNLDCTIITSNLWTFNNGKSLFLLHLEVASPFRVSE